MAVWLSPFILEKVEMFVHRSNVGLLKEKFVTQETVLP